MPHILVTGATGFIGSKLMENLSISESIKVSGTVRKAPANSIFNYIEVGDIDGETNYSVILPGVDVVIHTAAYAHTLCGKESEPFLEYRRVNVDGTLNLARQAAAAGVRRFIFISSVKVNGETTTGILPFSDLDVPLPVDGYGISKLEAEEGLKKISAETGMEFVIIRPPLVYGPGVKGNFKKLLKLSTKNFPLPFALVNNCRSMLFVDNLIDFIFQCVVRPVAANQIFLISDGEDVSLRKLIESIRTELGRSPYLFPVPLFFFKMASKLLRKKGLFERMLCNLKVDTKKAHELLDWYPPYTFSQGISITVADFIKVHSR